MIKKLIFALAITHIFTAIAMEPHGSPAKRPAPVAAESAPAAKKQRTAAPAPIVLGELEIVEDDDQAPYAGPAKPNQHDDDDIIDLTQSEEENPRPGRSSLFIEAPPSRTVVLPRADSTQEPASCPSNTAGPSTRTPSSGRACMLAQQVLAGSAQEAREILETPRGGSLLTFTLAAQGRSSQLRKILEKYPQYRDQRATQTPCGNRSPGDTLLHAAARHNGTWGKSNATMHTLIGLGLDVNVRNELDQTPLHVATEGGNVKAARVLLCRGANPLLPDKNGKTALDLAHESLMDDKTMNLFEKKAKEFGPIRQ